jgi:copper chaperone CopZ
MKTAMIRINGMHCRSCEGLLTDVLMDIKGVKTAKVSFNDKEAEVEFDERQTSEAELRRAIEKEGYKTG